jgi:hypothetical protein
VYIEVGGRNMSNNKLSFYFFGEVGNYDCYNPKYVCDKEHASEILYIIASNEPFSISKYEISKQLNISEEKVNDVTNSLELINAIEIKDNTYRIIFPVFLEKDVLKMKSYINKIGESIGKKIIDMKDIIYKNVSYLECSKEHNNKRILYHIICDKIFNGTAFDFLEEKEIVCTKKLQPDNRNYRIVAYEQSEEVEKHSNKFIVSSNTYKSSGFVFNSFGDSNAYRKDMFRFFKLIEKNLNKATPFHDLNIAYIKVIEDMNKEIAKSCGELIRNIIINHTKYNEFAPKERNLIDMLKELEYINIDKEDESILINIPVFFANEKNIIKDISDAILLNIFPIMREGIEEFEANTYDLTAMKHNVKLEEIVNQLGRQILGETSKYLAREGFIAVPDNIGEEGRYLRSFSINYF